MKAKIVKPQQEHEFEPFDLVITIEDEEDLYDVWARMYLTNSEVPGLDKRNPDRSSEPFEEIHNVVCELFLSGKFYRRNDNG